MSISISPAITTTPVLDSLFPIYYDDLTEEQKQRGVTLALATDATLEVGAEYAFTITPTSGMYAIADEPGEKGEPITTTGTVVERGNVKGIQLERVLITSTLEQPTENDMSFTAKVFIGSTGK